MAVTRRAAGTTEHFNGGAAASPQSSAGTASITIQAGDTAVFVALSYAPRGSGVTGSMAVKVAGVSMTAVTGTKVIGFGGLDQDGYTEIFQLLDPVTAIGSTGAKSVVGTISYTGSLAVDMCITPWVVIGTLGTITGGHATSTNGASTITSGSLTVGTGGYGAAIAANGTAAPTVNTGTSIASLTGSTNTGSDNTLCLDETANGALIANTNSADEEQMSWLTVLDGGGAADPFPAGYQPDVRQHTVYRL